MASGWVFSIWHYLKSRNFKNYDPALKIFLWYYLKAIMQWVGGKLMTQLPICTSVTAYTCIAILSPVKCTVKIGTRFTFSVSFLCKPTTLLIHLRHEHIKLNTSAKRGLSFTQLCKCPFKWNFDFTVQIAQFAPFLRPS